MCVHVSKEKGRAHWAVGQKVPGGETRDLNTGRDEAARRGLR